MSEMVKKKKYDFISSVRLPNIDEIIEAASDFSAPTDKKITIGSSARKASSIVSEIKKQNKFSLEQLEMEKLGLAVADEEARRAKEKELARAEELRRLCREREAMKQKAALAAAGKPVDQAAPSDVAAPVSESVVSSDIAENPFDAGYKPTKKVEKQEFHETILKDDYTEEMEFREDTSESVDDDFMDF